MERAEESTLPQPQHAAQAGRAARPARPLEDPTLAPFLQQSPTLREGIRQLQLDGIQVEWGKPRGGTYIVPDKMIVIDPSAIGRGGAIAGALSHEIGHHLYNREPDQSSKQAYVKGLLDGEAAATINNAKVRLEILAHKGPDIGLPGTGGRPQKYEAIAGQYLSGHLPASAAVDQIGQVFKTEHPSVAPKSTYEQYYGDDYDRHVAPFLHKQRKPEPAQGAPVDVDSVVRSNDPRQPGHPDHTLQHQISTQLQALGGRYAQHADAYSLAMLHDAKAHGVTRVDQIVASNATGDRAAGATLFLVQGNAGDPGAMRVGINAAAVAAAPVEASLQKLQQQTQEQAAQAPLQHSPAQQHDAPAIGAR